jgi:hypothetical protein
MEIMERITHLPSDLKQYIYEEFLDPLIFYEKINAALQDPISQRLSPMLIRPFIPIILAKPRYTAICRNIEEFDYVYKKHKIQNQKHFLLMNNGDSFATAILFYMYH